MQCCVLTVETPGPVGNGSAITERFHRYPHPTLTPVKQWQVIRIRGCMEEQHRVD